VIVIVEVKLLHFDLVAVLDSGYSYYEITDCV